MVVLLAQKHVGRVVVCDDGSEDMTAELAERLGAEVIRHERNMGKGEAMRTLFSAARRMHADIMVTIDGDYQHDADEIPKLLAPIRAGEVDIVIGARFHGDNRDIPTYRKVGNKVLNAATLDGVSDTQSGFRSYNRKAISLLHPAEMGMGVDSEILMEASRQGLRIGEVPITVRYGIGKTSTHNPLFHTMDVLLSALKIASIRHPMLFYGMPGMGVSLVGLYFVLHAFLLFSAQQTITNVTVIYALIGFSVGMVGLFTFFTGIILFTVSTVVRKN